MNKRRIIGSILSLALVAGGLVTWTLGSASGAVAFNRINMTSRYEGPGDHRKQVDSIKQFGVPVSAHPHNGWGRVCWSSTSSAVIPLSPTHLDDPGYLTPCYDTNPTYNDWSLYWAPTGLLSGVEMQPQALKITLQSPAGVHVDPEPFGETFIAGDSSATITPAHIRFTCGDLDGPGSPLPMDCTSVPGGVVTAEATFPDCYDGGGSSRNPTTGVMTFDTPAGISPSHFSYSVNGACPPGTVPCVPGTLIAQLVTRDTWIDPRTGGPLVNPIVNGVNALTFASGGPSTYHFDYLSTWSVKFMNLMTDQCLNHVSPNGCTNVNNVPIL